ncbi:alpha/beta hydrolase [Aeromicrobium sp. CF4.19]|uniref:alpha/beta hydrolase n=1 Tax=Aeromicrobium sp. CF4.19 TaxID=3373082 RepID=UPI003EE6B1CE
MIRLPRTPRRPEQGVAARTVIVGTVLALVLVAAVGAGAYVALRGEDSAADPAPVAQGVPEDLERFYSQDVDWEDCGDDRCATIEVPVDYEEPDGEVTELRMRRIPASGDGNRVMFVNPGGPGGSAIDFAGTAAGLLPEEVTDEYDVVGVDPRGVGESTPIDCLSDADFDDYLAGQSDPDVDDTTGIEALREETEAFGEGCRELSGELADHVSTAEVARDMDVARALMGQDELDWFGVSYGTQIGATYATLFPENVGRMVLDGAVDPAEDGIEGSLGQARGFQKAVEAYIADCVESAECPLGRDADAALDRLVDVFDGLADEPLPSRLDDRQLGQGQAFYGIAVTLYDEETWRLLTQGLQAALEGDGTVLLALSDAYFSRQPDGTYAGNTGEVISVISCLDQRDRPSLEETKDLLDDFDEASPVFGGPMGWGTLACSDLGFESQTPQVEIDAAGAPPIVVIGTTGDPATPYENAGRLVEQLGEDVGVLVTREGEGHTAYTSGNPCITDAVDAFFAEGTVPENDLTCPAE